MTFTHIVTFKWRGGDVPATDIAEALRALVSTLDGVRSYLCGPDAGVTPDAYDFAVVGAFDDAASFTAYRDHPEHRRILTEMILPNVETRTVVQIEE